MTDDATRKTKKKRKTRKQRKMFVNRDSKKTYYDISLQNKKRDMINNHNHRKYKISQKRGERGKGERDKRKRRSEQSRPQ